MSADAFQPYLGVKWFDGLLVNSSHLSHVDERVDRLVSGALTAFIDQPGLVGEDATGRTSHQLVEIDTQSKTDSGIDVHINVTRAFRAVTPEGRLLLGIPNKQGPFGVPTSTIAGHLAGPGEGDFLLCVRYDADNELAVQAKEVDDTAIELKYPSLELQLMTPADYSRGLGGEFAALVPIGLVSVVDGELVVDTEYIPPVTRLGLVKSFDEGLLPSLNALLVDLYRVISDLVHSGVLSNTQGEMGVDFIVRLVDYQALRGFLLGKLGMIGMLDRISPVRLHYELVHPIAVWWKHYYDKHFKDAVGVDQSPVQKILKHANKLTETTYGDICTASHPTLYSSKQFLEGLNGELGIVG